MIHAMTSNNIEVDGGFMEVVRELNGHYAQ